MLSIIICARTKTINDILKKNIENTIGCDYELIVIDNSRNQFSIFEAYNEGIKKSKFKYMCFVHDDILFHTMDWGKIVNSIFEDDKEIGLIGVAGSKIKTKMPSGWWGGGSISNVVNIIQHDNSGNIELQNFGFSDNLYEPVVVVDGVFMAARKNTLIYFNEELKGFHNYDFNISIEYCINNYKIIVSNEILIEHFSLGTLNKSWYESSLKIFSLYHNHFPLSVHTNTMLMNEIKKREIINGATFILKLIEYGYYKDSMKFWFILFKQKLFTNYHSIIIKFLLKKSFLK